MKLVKNKNYVTRKIEWASKVMKENVVIKCYISARVSSQVLLLKTILKWNQVYDSLNLSG